MDVERYISPDTLLIERFHMHSGFHPGQREIIERLIKGQRILAIQRTGWGKSLCYQMASLYYPHLTIVFSPLKALMRDQYQRSNDRYHIPSAIISSDFRERDNRRTLEHASNGQIKLLYIAPERLGNALWQRYVFSMRISMIVIDEAHCISTWGHDFRPDYRRILHLLEKIPPHTPILALTATANARVEADIHQQMGTHVHIIRGSMYRPNLCLNVISVRGEQAKLRYIARILPILEGTGIIYTATRHATKVVATFLQQQGIAAEYYHADREDSEKQDIEQRFMDNQYKVLCATNALGMGIDKKDVRFIIHYHIPASPIHYYQEIGRAGRDGLTSWCTLLYDPRDLAIQKHFIAQSRPESARYRNILTLLQTSHQGLGEREIIQETGYSQHITRIILAHLVDQHCITYDARQHLFTSQPHARSFDLTAYEQARNTRLEELHAMQHYTQLNACYMRYLISYLGDPFPHPCGRCRYCKPANFPDIDISR
jgi:ATP-dependent DNA helicase RecQ